MTKQTNTRCLIDSYFYANLMSVVYCQNQYRNMTKQTNTRCLIDFYFYANFMSVVCCQNQYRDMTKQTNTQCLIDFYLIFHSSTRSLINNLLLSPVVTTL